MKIQGKVAFITGGIGGFGKAFAEILLKNGIKGVALIDVSPKGSEIAEKLASQYGPRVKYFKADVTNSDEFNAAFVDTIKHFNHLDIVINNAGIADEVDWKKMIAINLTALMEGTYLAMEKYLPKHKSSEEGLIINLASVAGLDLVDYIPGYVTVKHGAVAFSRCMGSNYHFQRTNVKVVTLCPGVTETTLMAKSKVVYMERRDHYIGSYKTQPIEAVSKALLELIEKGANGTAWVVDSGPMYEVKFPVRKELEQYKL